MADAPALNPFQPGTGRLPPYLAGRRSEQRLFRACLRTLARGVPVAAEVVLCGPRGNGKTALLRWIRREAASALDTLWLTPSRWRDVGELAALVQPDPGIRRLLPDEAAALGGKWRLAGDRLPQDRLSLEEALVVRARETTAVAAARRGAHARTGFGAGAAECGADGGRGGSAAPGPGRNPRPPRPALRDRSVVLEPGPRTLPIGRLDDEAAAEAIRRPLAAGGMGIEDAALQGILRASDGYPYFVQLWGEAVWEQIQEADDGARTVTEAVVDAVTEEFETRRDHYYLDRYDELRKRRLLPVAREVAAAFGGGLRLTDARLEEAVRSGIREGGPEPAEAEETLRGLGFVWRSDARPVWEPGIPSLMDYILEEVPPPDRRRAG